MTCHKYLLVAGVAAALFAQSAFADCPPGYLSKAGHCIPGKAQPYHPPVIAPTLHAAPTAVPPSAGGKVSLNPQPIPPGHILRKPSAPTTNTPTGQTPHGDVKANKQS